MTTERRRFLRLPCLLPVRIVPRGEHRAIETLTKTVSLGGLKCISPVERPVSTPVTVELSIGPGREPILLQGHVAWFEGLPHTDQFHLGIAFDGLDDRMLVHLSRYLDRISTSLNPSNL